MTMTHNKAKYILLLTQSQNTGIQHNTAVWKEYCMYTESDLLFNKTNETNRIVTQIITQHITTYFLQ
jgi:hypothetical protein